MNPSKQEGQDYVLVGANIWSQLKKAFGGGPEIQFFLTNNEKVIEEESLYQLKNFLYQTPYSMYGYPDKHPEYVSLTLKLKDVSAGAPEQIQIPYRLLLSQHMTPKSFLYHCATKLGVDINKLTLVVKPEDSDATEFTHENDGIMLSEINCFFTNPTLTLLYSGTAGKCL